MRSDDCHSSSGQFKMKREHRSSIMSAGGNCGPGAAAPFLGAMVSVWVLSHRLRCCLPPKRRCKAAAHGAGQQHGVQAGWRRRGRDKCQRRACRPSRRRKGLMLHISCLWASQPYAAHLPWPVRRSRFVNQWSAAAVAGQPLDCSHGHSREGETHHPSWHSGWRRCVASCCAPSCGLVGPQSAGFHTTHRNTGARTRQGASFRSRPRAGLGRGCAGRSRWPTRHQELGLGSQLR